MGLYQALAIVGIVTCLFLIAYISRISDSLEDVADELDVIRQLLSEGELQIPPIKEWREENGQVQD